MRHIFIGGSSFCGSTLMALTLGGLRGVGNANESQWLIEPKASDRASGSDLPITTETIDRFPACRLCGPDCPVWTVDFRRQLQLDPSDWFDKLAARLETDTLVTAEKSITHLSALGSRLHCDAVILFKDPYRFAESWIKRPKGSLRRGLRFWSSTYWQLLRAPFHGRRIVVATSDFQRAPEATLQRICQELDLAYDPAALRYWEGEQHYMGGNFNVYQRLAERGPERLAIAPPSPIRLEQADRNRIDGHLPTQHIYRKLLRARAHIAGGETLPPAQSYAASLFRAFRAPQLPVI